MDKRDVDALEREGFSVDGLQGLQVMPKMVYYRPDGSPTGLLPADAVNLKLYLRKGFSLTPPKPKVVEVPLAPEAPLYVAPPKPEKAKRGRRKKKGG